MGDDQHAHEGDVAVQGAEAEVAVKEHRSARRCRTPCAWNQRFVAPMKPSQRALAGRVQQQKQHETAADDAERCS
ncbi:MAG: hypothetical protein U1F11_14805 [Steroidobacteraceae bacterium]